MTSTTIQHLLSIQPKPHKCVEMGELDFWQFSIMYTQISLVWFRLLLQQLGKMLIHITYLGLLITGGPQIVRKYGPGKTCTMQNLKRISALLDLYQCMCNSFSIVRIPKVLF